MKRCVLICTLYIHNKCVCARIRKEVLKKGVIKNSIAPIIVKRLTTPGVGNVF